MNSGTHSGVAKRWCFTLFDYTDNDEATFKALNSQYLVYGREVCPTTKSPHLQGFVTFATAKRLSAMKKIHGTCHWEVAKGTSQQASDYCKKEGDWHEQGVVPSPGMRTDIKHACDLIKAGETLRAVANAVDCVFVKYGRGLRDLKLTLDVPYTNDTVRGEWYWGLPGTGKSHKARFENPDAYIKAQNKWWDNYQGEAVVILDDLDSNMLGHHLKIWADRYACTGETKGGTVNLQHRKLIVTSNYSIEQLWEDEQMREAIKRRFKVTHFSVPFKKLN